MPAPPPIPFARAILAGSRASALVAVGVLLAASAGCRAQSPVAASPPPGSDLVPGVPAMHRTPGPPARGSRENGDSASGGRVRLIVELRPTEPSPGALHPPDARARKAAILEARRHLLATLPPGSASVVRSYDTIPYVVLEATPEVEAALRTSPLVQSIQVDQPMKIQKAPASAPGR